MNLTPQVKMELLRVSSERVRAGGGSASARAAGHVGGAKACPKALPGAAAAAGGWPHGALDDGSGSDTSGAQPPSAPPGAGAASQSSKARRGSAGTARSSGSAAQTVHARIVVNNPMASGLGPGREQED